MFEEHFISGKSRKDLSEQRPDDKAINIERCLEAARIRLFHLARKEGVPEEAIEDVVQETLLEAWHHLTHAGVPQYLDAWLDGICRNMCRRWRRMTYTALRRYTRLPDWYASQEGHQPEGTIDLTDPFAFDPVELLNRQDLEYLLARALSYLPAQVREIVELCYLKELPQRQVALQLGLTLGALEERLRRARHQLRQVLNSELRLDAEALDIHLDTDPLWGWRQTREWCHSCGQHRVRGIFEPAKNKRIALRLRCPHCSQQHGLDVFGTKGIVPLEGKSSFLPALKRSIQVLATVGTHSLQTQTCPRCGGPARIRITDDMQNLFCDPSTHYWFRMDCQACGPGAFSAGQLVSAHPAVQRFIARYPRWVIESDQATEYAGQPALRFRFRDSIGTARLIILAHYHTLQVLAAYLE